jgi:drug/metabolite transporter (DMT)-like permease
VQPALASGLLVLMFLAERMLGERAGRNEYLAMSAIVLGVIGAGLTAPPNSSNTAGDLLIVLVLAGLAAIALLPYLLRVLHRHSPAAMTMIGAGCAFGWGGVATKLAADDLAQGRLAAAAAWGLATGAASAVGLLSEASALQSRPAIQVAPVVFVTQTVVPVALAPVLFAESFRDTPLGGVPLAFSLLLLVSGAALLARSPLLVALMEGESVNPLSGSASSRSEPSEETMRSSPATEEADPSTVITKTSPARVRR